MSSISNVERWNVHQVQDVCIVRRHGIAYDARRREEERATEDKVKGQK